MLVDYNSWVETDQSRKLANSLDRDFILAEGWSSSWNIVWYRL